MQIGLRQVFAESSLLPVLSAIQAVGRIGTGKRFPRSSGSHGTEVAASDSNGPSSGACFCPTYILGFLGLPGVHAHRRHGGRHRTYPPFLARAVLYLVWRQTRPSTRTDADGC